MKVFIVSRDEISENVDLNNYQGDLYVDLETLPKPGERFIFQGQDLCVDKITDIFNDGMHQHSIVTAVDPVRMATEEISKIHANISGATRP